MIRCLLAVLLTLSVSSLLATNIYVDQSAPAGGDGSSWANAFQDIQSAVDVAAADDTIFIAAGIYRPESEIDITVPLSIKGGYPQGGGAQDIDANTTQIQADFNPANLLFTIFDIKPNAQFYIEGTQFLQARRAITTYANISINNVQFNESSTADLWLSDDIDFCTVTNSTFTGCVGSSLYLFSYQVNNLLVDNCVFQNGTGRALFIHDEVLNTTFTNSIIRNYNSTTSIATLASPNTTINKLTIDNNSSSDVIQLEGANTQINNLTATNNSCTSRILFHFEGTAIITNSTFNNNLGTGECIQTTQNCYLTLENVDFIDNTITDSPIIRGNGEAFFANDCKFINNETSGTFSTIVDLRGDDGADIAFDNCEIKNNRSGYGSTFDISYDADVVINNCVFENNGQSGEGDLDFWTLKSAEITNNRFDSNTSTEPVIKIGFMMVDNALIRNNTFLNNTGSEVEADRIDDLTLSYNVYYGNSIFLDIDRVPIARLNNEYFEGNNTNSEFIRFDETTARINNMTMISTLPSGNHTLIESANDVALRILNSTISAKNYTDTNVRVDFDNDVPSWVRNSIIWSGNDLSQSAFSGSTTNLTVRNSLIKGEDPPGAGNLDGTQNSNRPRFSDPSDLDFRVRNCSPTINAGNNTYQNLTIDLLTNPRIFETTIDMGAYEFQDAYNASCETPERPLCTQLELPTDGSTNIALDTMLEWTGSPNAIGYILRVGTSLGASDILNTTLGNDTTYNLSEDLPPNTEIFVRIIPFNGTGNALSCVSESFTTASVPNCSSLISPSDGVIDVAVDSNITWSPSANATGYIIRIGDALGSFNLVNTVVGNITTYDLPSDLPEGTEIFVRVIPFNPIGNANSCLSESFTTETLISIPNCTTISMPLDGDTDVPITSDLSWNSVPSADNYSVTIGTTSGGTDIFDNISVGINTTVSLPNFPENTEIFVTIVPSNSEGDAIGCAEESFTTETLATIPNCTNLTSPLDGATGVFPVSGITWNPITNADGYLVTVTTTSGVNNFTNADVTTNTLDLISQAFTVGDLVTVLVIPYNSAGEAIGCTSESYTIIDEPACTNLIEPLNNALNVPVNTDLSWNADDEAIGYRLSIGTTSGGTDILDNFNTGNTTYNLPADLPESTEIFVTIIPYNVLFTASGCTQESFTTETLVNTNAFITTWKTDNAGVSNNDQITIPTFGTGYNYNVDWGDGNATTGETGNATHTYASIGTYTVSITGDFPRIRFNNGFDKDKILTIEQWGDNPWTTMENAFFGCTNLNITNPNIDEPNLTNLTELDRMFEDCTSFNGDVTNWDVSNVESLRSLFRGATIFNQDIGNWDVSNVQYLSRTFANALAFNQDISSWNVSNVTNMLLTFYNAESFNQPIQSWDVSNVTSFARIFEETDVFNQPIGIWDTSSATIISGMFNEAVAFNQDISNWDVSNATLFRNTFEGAILFNQDISSWDTSSATDMLFMFKDAIAFNQDISSWDVSQVFRMFAMFENATAFDQDLSAWNVQSLTTAERMFDGVTLSTANYDALLIGWNAQNLQPNVPFSGGDSQYCDGEVARTNMITGDGWMITDGGSASPNITALANQTHSNSYTLPVINGTNLTGSERYYTAPNGGGTIYSAGEIINFADFPSYPVILYIYDGSGLCASEESFTLTLTNDIIPSCTSLTTPLNGTTDVSIITDLTWTAIANADGYLVTVGTTSGDNDILDNENVTATTFDLPADLPENTEIFVTITPYNGVGNATGCAEESFITETLATIPNCTTLTTPLNGSTDISIITDLTWTAIANADGYLVTVGTTSGGNDILDNEDITATTFDLPTDLPENTDIFVTIIPYNGVGNATGCIEESFTTETLATIPNCTTLTTPLNGSTDVSIITDLTWTAIANADGYLVTVGTTSGGNDILDNFDAGNLTTLDLPTDLSENIEIFVTIIPYNAVGNATGCAEESFTTEAIITLPGCTALTTPLNGANNVPVDTNLNWDAATDATNYIISIGFSPGGSEIILNQNLGNSLEYDPFFDFPPNTEIFVRILPSDAFGNSSTNCIEESFITGLLATIPNCTTLTTPLNGSTDISIITDLTWTAITDVDGYFVTVGTTSGGNDILDNFDNGNLTTLDLPADLPENTEIFVTIIPYNAIGNATGCTEESFTTETLATIPNCTALTSPLNGSTDVSIITDLTWTAIVNADGYLVTVGTTSGGNDILDNFDNGNLTTLDLPVDLPENTEIFTTIIPYNSEGSATGCAEESFTTETLSTFPSCTTLIDPLDNAINVSIATDLNWNAVSNATGYLISVGTTSGGSDILFNQDVGDTTTFNLPTNLPENTEIFVSILPYNSNGNNPTGCTEESFITETLATIPNCTSLTTPLNGSTDISIITDLTWTAIVNADGYLVTVGTTSGGNDILDNFDNGNLTILDLPADLPENTEIFVTIIPYNAIGNAIGCAEESFVTETLEMLPNCTTLTLPLDGSIDVPVNTDFSWNPVSGATGYRINIGDNVNFYGEFDVGNNLTFDLGFDLPENELIFVRIIPYNGLGDAIGGCTNESFTTGSISALPICTQLLAPLDLNVNVSPDTDLTWVPEPNATGYRLSVGTISNGTDILDNVDVGNFTTYDILGDLPENTDIFVLIIPYNDFGDAEGCTEEYFTTGSVNTTPEDDNTKYGFSPDGNGINDYWHIDGIENHPNNVVTIYNRWGDLVFQIRGYDNYARAFRGEANKKTNMGAGKLPSGTYFFHIIIDGEHHLKKTKGFVVIKR